MRVRVRQKRDYGQVITLNRRENKKLEMKMAHAQHSNAESDSNPFLFSPFAQMLATKGVSLDTYMKGSVLEIAYGCPRCEKLSAYLQDRGSDYHALVRGREAFYRSLKEANSPKQITLGDPTKMIYPDETFDMVFSSMLYFHGQYFRDDFSGVPREINRVLKAGGLYLVVDARVDLQKELFAGFETLDSNTSFLALCKLLTLHKPTHPTPQSKE